MHYHFESTIYIQCKLKCNSLWEDETKGSSGKYFIMLYTQYSKSLWEEEVGINLWQIFVMLHTQHKQIRKWVFPSGKYFVMLYTQHKQITMGGGSGYSALANILLW